MSDVDALQEQVEGLRYSVDTLAAKLDRTLRLLTGVVVKKDSITKQAKRLGVSPSTLYRRRQRAKTRALMKGNML